MYIGKEKKYKKLIISQAPEENEVREESEADESETRETEDEIEIVDPETVVYKWKAPEHEVIEKDKQWFLIAGLILAGIVMYAILTDGIIMAITFILIGMVGYIVLNRTPRIINFYITDDGVIADKEIYEFEKLQSFWIFYENEGLKSISLHLKSKLAPHVHIPLGDEDPVLIRETLSGYLEEIKQKPSLVDDFERIMKI